MTTQRDPLEGPWVSVSDIERFEAWCKAHGYQTRQPKGITNPTQTGFEIRHQGNWMGIRWNRGTERYTADRRLSLVVQSFAATNGIK